MKKLEYLSVLFTILFIGFAQASVLCTPNSITQNLTQGAAQATSTITCSNSGNDTTLIKNGNFFSMSENTIIGNANNKVFTLTFDTSLEGTFFGSISFSDGSTPLSITSIINPVVQPIGSCRLIVFPTTYRRSMQSGETGTKTVEVQVSKYCKTPLNIHLTPSEETTKPINFDDISGDIDPGQKFTINLLFDANGVQNGDYSKQIRIQGIDEEEKTYEAVLSVSAKISGTISPITNSTFSTLPLCNVATDMNLNTTYDLTCTSVDANLEAVFLYSDFFEGVRADEGSNSITYTLRPTKVGNSNIRVVFSYKGLPISSFYKEIRVTQGGMVIPGTISKFVFYPALSEIVGEGDIRVLLIDNKTESVINGFRLVVDGADYGNNTLHFKTGKEYELRGIAYGYPDAITKVKLNSMPITIQLVPEKADYSTGEAFTVTTNPNETAIFLDGAIASNPIIVYNSGSHVIKAVKDGYIYAERNISVSDRVSYSTTPLKEEWKTGNKVLGAFSKNVSWGIEINGVTIASGVGTTFEFTPKDKGTYTIKANNIVLDSVLVNKSGFWQDWMWWAGGGIIGLVMIIYLVRKSSDTSDATIFSPGER